MISATAVAETPAPAPVVPKPAALVADGLRPYQFSYEQVVDAPTEVVDQTRTALATWS